MDEENKVEKLEEQSENFKSLIEKNLKWSQIIYEQNKKIKRRLDWIVWGGVFKWVLILLPIIAALIYLPPLLRPLIEQYSHLLSGASSVNLGTEQLNTLLRDISPAQLQEAMKILGR